MNLLCESAASSSDEPVQELPTEDFMLSSLMLSTWLPDTGHPSHYVVLFAGTRNDADRVCIRGAHLCQCVLCRGRRR